MHNLSASQTMIIPYDTGSGLFDAKMAIWNIWVLKDLEHKSSNTQFDNILKHLQI